MSLNPADSTKWSDRLSFEMALMLEGSGEPLQDVINRHGLTLSDMVSIQSDPVFIKKVEHYRTEITEKGLTFRLKARAQAEELLTTSWLLIHDPIVSPAVKAELIKSTVRWGGLEPKNETQVDAAGNGGVRITINLGGQNHSANIIEASTTHTIEESDATSIEYRDDV